MKAQRIAFFGTPPLARACLSRLSESFDVRLVVTMPDRAQGRGQKIGISPVKNYAVEHGIDIYQTDEIGRELLEILSQRKIDLNVVVAYGKILPSQVIDLPPLGSVNLHASMLPKYRGPSPVEAAILNGEQKTGITLQQMKQRMDSGDIILQKEIRIADEDTSRDLLERIMDIAPGFLIEGIRGYISGALQPERQREEDATYCSMIRKEDGLIDWREVAGKIYNKIRAYTLWPVAYTWLDGKLLKIFQARISPGKDELSAQPGKVVRAKAEEGIIVKAREGLINILELQLENRRRMSSKEFIKGYRNLEGKLLGSLPS